MNSHMRGGKTLVVAHAPYWHDGSKISKKNYNIMIAALPAVDGLFFGPYDLSSDLGSPGDFRSAAFVDALDQVKAACQAHGKAAGGHQVATEPAELRQRIEEGFRLLAYGTDIIAMRQSLAGYRDAIPTKAP